MVESVLQKPYELIGTIEYQIIDEKEALVKCRLQMKGQLFKKINNAK